jgi:hypothetical protein
MDGENYAILLISSRFVSGRMRFFLLIEGMKEKKLCIDLLSRAGKRARCAITIKTQRDGYMIIIITSLLMSNQNRDHE